MTAFSRPSARAGIAAALLAATCALGGCASSGAVGSSFAMATDGAPAAGSTVAFESIDGPPPQVFERMVGMLDSETKLRNLSVVSREGSAAYRVRGYLSAQVVRGKTTIAWVFDVYDRDQQRALRLSGEEPTGRPGRDPWSAADDLVLRKIAQAGLSGIAGMINGGPADQPPASPAPAPPRRGPAVASIEPAPEPAESHTPSALAYTDR
jgi:hypothetical protein